MRLRVSLLAWAALVGVLIEGNASAVGTRTFELRSLDDFTGGDVTGVSVGSDGVVRAGWTLGTLALPDDAGTTATCAVTLGDGSVLVGTGPAAGGKVVRIANDRATVFADLKENAVSALALDKRGVAYAATTSNTIYRLSQGKAEVFATLPGVDSVLAIAFDAAGALYAATGSEGRILRIDPAGVATLYFKADDPFVVSLAAADDGALYAGTSGKGLLYRIAGPGRASVLYDFRGEDVHALAVGPRHSLWAIVNEGASGSSSDSQDSTPAHHNTGGRTPSSPSSAPRSKPGKGSLWRFDSQGRPERLMHHEDTHYLALALDEQGTPYVGTGAEGRVYTVDDAHVVSLVADTDERQIGAIGLSGRARYAIGSDPAVYHRILSVGGADAVWTSKPFDAGLRARFGHLTWTGTGTLEVSTRTGDTRSPDSTWSPWSKPVVNGGMTANPDGRFVQLRARLRDATSTISALTIAFVTENLRAVVTEIVARSKSARESKEGLVQSGGEPPKHDSVVHVTWKVENPDNDDLRYRVQFRREGGGRWIDATKADEVLTKPELDWDTMTLPEGRYRLRVDASDDISNPPNDAMHHALEAPAVIVDNTPPVFKSVEMQGRHLRAEIVDGVGPIVRVEAAFDGQLEWRPLASADGIFDTPDESVDTDITPLVPGGPGPHVVAIRAYDAAGNFVVHEIETP